MNLRKADLVKLYQQQSIGYPDVFLKDILRPTGRGNVYAARDYIAANAILAELNKAIEAGAPVDYTDFHSKADLKKALDPATRFRLNMYTPCLAYRFDELSEKDQNKLLDNPQYWCTEKQNGVRGIFVYCNGQCKLFSRNYSQRDCSLPEYWGNIDQNFHGDKPFVVDVEVKYEADSNLQDQLEEFGLITKSKLEAITALLAMNQPQALKIQQEYFKLYNRPLIVFRLITVLYFNGVDYRKKTLGDAYQVESQVIQYAQERGLNLKPIQKMTGTRAQKEAFIDGLIDSGSEGCFRGTCRVIMADGSKKPIKDIKVGDKVMSFDGVKVVESEVEHVWLNGHKTEWCNLDWHLDSLRPYKGSDKTYNPSYSRIYITPNHKVYDNGEFVPVTEAKSVSYLRYKVDEFRRQALLGWILADGCVERRSGSIVLMQKADHPWWAATKEDFQGVAQKVTQYISGKGSMVGRLTIQPRWYRADSYLKPDRVDYVKICQDANEVALAYAFMGDGSAMHPTNDDNRKTSYRYNLHSFSKEELKAFQDLLLRYGITSSLKKDNRVKTGEGCAVFIGASDGNAERFAKLIGKYVHPSMKYKLGKNYVEEYIGPAPLELIAEPTTLKLTENQEGKAWMAYDLAVKGTHCYFVEGVLVHNCVFHNHKETYKTTENRDPNTFVKLKRSVSATHQKQGMGDTIDGFITGFTMSKEGTGDEGLIGSLEVSAYLQDAKGNKRQHVIAYVPNIERQFKLEHTIKDYQGNPTLDPIIYNLVVEVDGQEVSRRSKRLTHPRILRWRYDKLPEDCVYTEAFWDSQMDVSLDALRPQGEI